MSGRQRERLKAPQLIQFETTPRREALRQYRGTACDGRAASPKVVTLSGVSKQFRPCPGIQPPS